MKLNVMQSLRGLDGKPLLEDDEPIVLRTVCINAMLATLEEDRSQTGEDKLTAWTLAKRLHEEDEPDLTVEELSLLKDRVGKCFGPSVVGPVFGLLDGS